MKATINLTEKEILDIIVKHFNSKGIKVSGSVKFAVHKRYDFRGEECGHDVSLTIPVDIEDQSYRQAPGQFGDR